MSKRASHWPRKRQYWVTRRARGRQGLERDMWARLRPQVYIAMREATERALGILFEPIPIAEDVFDDFAAMFSQIIGGGLTESGSLSIGHHVRDHISTPLDTRSDEWVMSRFEDWAHVVDRLVAETRNGGDPDER